MLEKGWVNKQRTRNGCISAWVSVGSTAERKLAGLACRCLPHRVGSRRWEHRAILIWNSISLTVAQLVYNRSCSMTSELPTHQSPLLQKRRTSTGSGTGRKKRGRAAEQRQPRVHTSVSLGPPWHLAWTRHGLPRSTICSAAVFSAPLITPSSLPLCSKKKALSRPKIKLADFMLNQVLSNLIKALHY